jgi:hypothetical protein
MTMPLRNLHRCSGICSMVHIRSCLDQPLNHLAGDPGYGGQM